MAIWKNSAFFYSSGYVCFDLFPVAKRRSLFDDKAVEIEELTYIIKQVRFFVCLN